MSFGCVAQDPTRGRLLLSSGPSLYSYAIESNTLAPLGGAAADATAAADVIRAVAVDADGRYVAVSGEAKHVDLLDAETMARVARWVLPRKCGVGMLAFCRQGLISADRVGDLRLHRRPESGGEEAAGELLCSHLTAVTAMALAGDLVATAERTEKIRVARLPGAYDVAAFCLGHSDYVTSLAFDATSGRLASAGGDGCVMLWRAEEGELLHSLPLAPLRPQADGAALPPVSGLTLVSASGGALLLTVALIGKACLLVLRVDDRELSYVQTLELPAPLPAPATPAVMFCGDVLYASCPRRSDDAAHPLVATFRLGAAGAGEQPAFEPFEDATLGQATLPQAGAGGWEPAWYAKAEGVRGLSRGTQRKEN